MPLSDVAGDTSRIKVPADSESARRVTVTPPISYLRDPETRNHRSHCQTSASIMISWKSLPFLIYSLMHLYLFNAQWRFITQDGAVRAITYPLLAVAAGCLVDNARFTLSALLGLSGSFKWLMYLSFWCHLTVVPFLFLSMTYMLVETLPGHQWLVVVGHVITAVLLIHGLLEFQNRIVGNLVLTDDMGFIRYTLSRKKSSFSLIVPVILISVFSIIVGVIKAFYHDGLWLQLVVNIVCFVGQAQTPRLKEWGPLSSNLLEAVFLATLMSYQVDGPNVFA